MTSFSLALQLIVIFFIYCSANSINPALFVYAKDTKIINNQSKTSNQNEGFIGWKDPEGRFILEYPSNWTAQGKTNRFEDNELTLTSQSGQGVDVIVIDFYDKSQTIDSNNTLSLKKICDNITNNFGFLFKEYEIKEQLNFTKFTIGGYKACSLLFTYTPTEEHYRGVALFVKSLINRTQFDFVYATIPDNYDKVIPIVNKIIHSIQILKT